MRYFGKTLNREYTDLCVVYGPNVRWTEDGYEDLLHAFPEVFLGYRVRLMVPTDVARGIRPEKLVVFEIPESMETMRYYETKRELLYRTTVGSYNAKVEHWFVHRGIGIYRTDEERL